MSKIKRSHRQTPFVQIDKRALQDKELSWKAKGLLAYLLSLPDDWEVYVAELCKHSTDGRDSTATGINELIQAGYIVRERSQDSSGKFSGYDYTVHETTVNGFSVNGSSVNGESVTNNKESTDIDSTDKDSPIDIEQPYLDFGKLWDMYAYKQNKKKAYTAWKRLSKAKKELLYDSVPHYLTYLQSPENAYRQQMLLATYINGEQWESDWSVETVDNTITTLIGASKLDPADFDKYGSYHAWVKEKHPGLFAKCRILTAKQYLSHLPGGRTYRALRKAMSQNMIRDAITQAHVSAAEKLEKGRAVESVAAELKAATEKTFA